VLKVYLRDAGNAIPSGFDIKMRWRSVFIFVGSMLAGVLAPLIRVLVPLIVNGSHLFGAFDLVFELILVGSEILALRLRTPDLPLLLDGGLVLNLSAPHDPAGKRIDLSHKNPRLPLARTKQFIGNMPPELQRNVANKWQRSGAIKCASSVQSVSRKHSLPSPPPFSGWAKGPHHPSLAPATLLVSTRRTTGFRNLSFPGTVQRRTVFQPINDNIAPFRGRVDRVVVTFEESIDAQWARVARDPICDRGGRAVVGVGLCG
jgi:hypothetical protein